MEENRKEEKKRIRSFVPGFRPDQTARAHLFPFLSLFNHVFQKKKVNATSRVFLASHHRGTLLDRPIHYRCSRR